MSDWEDIQLIRGVIREAGRFGSKENILKAIAAEEALTRITEKKPPPPPRPRLDKPPATELRGI